MKHTEGSGSILKSRLARGAVPLMATFLAFALSAPSARAEVLVYEGFHSQDYTTSTTATELKAKNPTENNTGFSSDYAWSADTAVPKTIAGSLTLGASFDISETNGTGRAIMNNTGTEGKGRGIYRKFTASIPTGGSVYFRFLMRLNSNASDYTGALQSGGYWAGGFVQNTFSGGSDDMQSLTTDGIWMGYKKVDSAISLFGRIGSTDYVFPYTTSNSTLSTWSTYIFIARVDIGKGTDGKDLVSLAVQPIATGSYSLEWDWTVKNVEANIVSGGTPVSYIAFAGQYQTNGKEVAIDQFKIATSLSEVCNHAAETQPEIGAISLTRIGTAEYSLSADEDANAADIAWIANSGSTATTNGWQSVAEGGTANWTVSGLAADTTYRISVLATNESGTVEVVAGTIYTGALTLDASSATDANEYGLVAGGVTVARATGDPFPLTVNYTISGSAGTEGTTWAAPVAVTIPANETSAVLPVVPLMDGDVTSDVTITVALASGNYELPASNVATLTLVNLVAPEGYITWVADADGLASVGSNWSSGVAPTTTDNVLFDGRFSSANCEWDADATATVASWTQTNGYSGVVTLDTVYPGKGDFQCLTVTGPMAVMSGTITHPQSRTQSESATDYLQDLLDNETYRVRIDAGSIVVGPDGRIDARNKGYYHSNSGNHTSPLPSHGGWFGASGQAPYDDVKEPVHIGMPYKRASGNYYVGIGGGAIYLTSAGAVVVDGYVGADTGSDTWNRNLTLRCGGAAGAVYVRGASVAGTGTISASALATAEQNYRGVGGRVAVIATSSTPIDYTTLRLKASVYPYNNSNKESSTYGGCGTVYVKDASQTYGTLLLDNADGAFAPSIARNTPVTTDGDWTFDSLGLGNYAILAVPVGTALHLPGGLDSVFSLNASGSTAYGSIRYEGGTLDLGSSTDQTMAGSWMLTGWTNLVLNADVTVKDGAAIGVPPMPVVYDTSTTGVLPDFVSCNLSVNGDLTVESTGSVLAKSCGMRKNRSDSNNGVLGFHSHGGRSLRWGKTSNLFYEAYDSVFSPGLPGCTVPYPDGQTAGAAGGAVRLSVSGTLTLNGSANANGLPESHNGAGNASGGAGGAIDITAGRLVGAGSIAANGGCYLWQRGPGGRVAVKLTSSGADFSSFSGTIEASGRARNDGYKGPGDASAGTVYLQTAADGDKAGTICIGQSLAESYYGTDGVSGNTNTTEMVSLGYGGDAIADYRKVKYIVRDYGRAAVNADMKAASIEIADANSSLDLEGHTLTVKSAKVNGVRLAPGTYTAGSTVAIGEGTLGDYLVDTAEGGGGALVVSGGGFRLSLR